jgi:hypothetical protein
MIVALCTSAFANAIRGNPKIQWGFDLFASLLFIGMGSIILITHL